MATTPPTHFVILHDAAPIFARSLVEVDVIEATLPGSGTKLLGHVVRDVASGATFGDAMTRVRRAMEREALEGMGDSEGMPLLRIRHAYRGRVLEAVLEALDDEGDAGGVQTCLVIEEVEVLRPHR